MATADYGSYPSQYKAVVEGYLHGRLKDPDSLRIQYLNAPQRGFQGLGGATYGYVVCATVNAKNSFGGYTGPRPAYFMIRNEAVVQAHIGDGSYGSAMAEGMCKNFVGNFAPPPGTRHQGINPAWGL